MKDNNYFKCANCHDYLAFVTREEIFITTKVSPGNYYNTDNSIDESLKKLKVDYIDLLLIHYDKEVYKAMERAVKDGKVKSIGISNYYTKKAIDEF